MSFINTSCPGVCDGFAEVAGMYFLNGYNPAPPYSYQWANGETTSSISDICPGYYEVTVIDAQGHTGVDTVLIDYSYIAELTYSVNNVFCPDSCNGSIEATLNNTNAFPSIIFHIEGNLGFNDSQTNTTPVWDFTGLCPDTYTITAIDTNGCQDSVVVVIEEPPPFYCIDSISAVDCNTSNMVNIDITTIGGYPPFSYEWGNGATTEDITVSSPGTYYLTITDMVNCTLTDTFTVDSVWSISVVINSIQPTCPDPYNGYLYPIITGGSSPFTYSWSNGQTTDTCFNIGPGQYFLTVTDDYGCKASTFGILNDYYLLNIFDTVIPPICPDTTNRQIKIWVVGGVPSYSYYWEENSSYFSNQANISGLTSGFTYTLTVTDNANCQITYSATMPDSELYFEFNVQGQGCNGPADNSWVVNGAVGVDVQGGNGTYWYDWGSGATTSDTLTGLTDSTVIYLSVTDSTGCTGSDSVLIGSKQTINQKSGWGYFSTYLLPFDYNNKTVPDYFIGQGLTSQVIILKNEVSAFFWPQYTFNSNNEFFYPGKAYQTNMNSEHDLFLMGRLACPEDHLIEKIPSWSYIGYLRTAESSIVNELSSVSQNVILVKEENGLIYWPQYGTNMIGNMIPGEGYQIKVDTTISFNFSNNDNNFGTKSEVHRTEWTFEHFTDDNNLFTTEFMVLMIPYESWDEVPEYGSEIGLIGESGQLVGRAIFEGDHTAFVVYGDNLYTETEEGLSESEEFTVAIWNPILKATKSLKITEWEKGNEQYEKGKVCIAGKSIEDEINLEYGGEFLVECYPNPSSGKFNINILSPVEDIVRINLFNLNGQLVFSSELKIIVGKQQLTFDGSTYSPGSYSMQITCSSKTLTQKLIIIH